MGVCHMNHVIANIFTSASHGLQNLQRNDTVGAFEFYHAGAFVNLPL